MKGKSLTLLLCTAITVSMLSGCKSSSDRQQTDAQTTTEATDTTQANTVESETENIPETSPSEGPVVNTVKGTLQGITDNEGVSCFYGIQYADAERFAEPHEIEPWEGIKQATKYGPACPTLTKNEQNEYDTYDEHCQYLNVWSTALEANEKKPVMVWIHGGGLINGSSSAMPEYDGSNMSRLSDVVVVSVNHRLNILGYLDVSPLGDAYKNSGTLGQQDLVMALRWIQNNIEATIKRS